MSLRLLRRLLVVFLELGFGDVLDFARFWGVFFGSDWYIVTGVVLVFGRGVFTQSQFVFYMVLYFGYNTVFLVCLFVCLRIIWSGAEGRGFGSWSRMMDVRSFVCSGNALQSFGRTEQVFLSSFLHLMNDNVMGTFCLPNIVRSLTHSNERKNSMANRNNDTVPPTLPILASSPTHPLQIETKTSTSTSTNQYK